MNKPLIIQEDSLYYAVIFDEDIDNNFMSGKLYPIFYDERTEKIKFHNYNYTEKTNDITENSYSCFGFNIIWRGIWDYKIYFSEEICEECDYDTLDDINILARRLKEILIKIIASKQTDIEYIKYMVKEI